MPTAMPTTNPGDVRAPEGAGGDFGDGPWRHAFWVTIDGAVVSKSNHRQDARSRGKWAQVSGYETQVRADVRRARPAGWDQGNKDAAVADRPRVVVALAARTMLDFGNVSKSVLDACQGVLYVTDTQVGGCAEFGTRTATRPVLVAAFAELPVGATAAQCALAVSELTARLAQLSTHPA